jgi:predicted permease
MGKFSKRTGSAGLYRAEELWQDMRYSFRQFRKSPGFAVTVILTLAISIGANLAVFQMLQAILFAELPVAAPTELYALHAVPSPFDGEWMYSYQAYQRLRQASGNAVPVFAHAGIGGGVLQLAGGFSERVTFQLVSDNFFSSLGLTPAGGRIFVPVDDDPTQLEVPVILRSEFAREKFGFDPVKHPLTGMKAVLNHVSIVVVGVAPEGFTGVMQGQAPDVWLPLSAQSTDRFGSAFDSLGPGDDHDLARPWRNQPGIFWLWAFARIPTGQQEIAANLWTQALQPDLHKIALAPVNSTRTQQERDRILNARVQLVTAASGQGSLSKRYLQPLTVLMAMAAMVFLVGCLNLANLQMARLASRQRELLLRIALGASRWRIVRQLLVEDLLLVSIGGVLALGTCTAASKLLLRWASGRDRLIPLHLQAGPQIFLVGLALLLIALAAFSLMPALWVTRGTGQGARLTRKPPAGRDNRRWSSLLLAGQVSLSLLLLSMAILFAQTLLNLSHLDAGLDREHLLSIHLSMINGSGDDEDTTNLNQRILDKLHSLPYVRDAALQMCHVPYCGWNTEFYVYGHPELAGAQIHGEENHVSYTYFHTLGIPVLAGRSFDARDRRKTQPVAILNHAYAVKLFGTESPVGHYIGYKAAPGDHDFLIVGEVGDAHVDGLRRTAPPIAYLSLEQSATLGQNYEVRAAGPPQSIAADIRQALRTVDPNLPIDDILPLDEEFTDGLSTERLLVRLTGTFSGITLALAAIGFYGLLSFHVQRRTSEIGVRMALGSTRGQVLRLFLHQTLNILIVGLIPGIAFTELLCRATRTLLYGVTETDPWALLLSISVLLTCGLLATLIPARRAARVDPMQALRTE